MPARRKHQDQINGKYLTGRGRVSSKGWVVIPKEIRDEMGIQPGDEIAFSLLPPLPGMKQDPALYSLHVTRVPTDPVAAVRGMFPRRRGEPAWTEQLLDDRMRERAREEREVQDDRRRRRKPA